MNTKTEIGQFLALQAKSVQELQELCTKLNLKPEGSQADLVDRLMGYAKQASPQKLHPQAIPLRTIDASGSPIPQAVETFKRWRKLIFNAKNNTREFGLVNGKGNPYKAKLRYIRCSEETLKALLERKWYFAHPSQEPMINALRERPQDFTVNIIQKPSAKGSSFIMLHAEEKKAA